MFSGEKRRKGERQTIEKRRQSGGIVSLVLLWLPLLLYVSKQHPEGNIIRFKKNTLSYLLFWRGQEEEKRKKKEKKKEEKREPEQTNPSQE